MDRTSLIYDILSFDLQMCLDLQRTRTNVSNGFSTPKREQLRQIILKFMHKCRSYGKEKSGRRMHNTQRTTHIQRTDQLCLTHRKGSRKTSQLLEEHNYFPSEYQYVDCITYYKT